MPKFLGMEPKTYLWVGGGLVALIVVYYVLKSRSGGGGGSVGGDIGGGGFGPVGASSPVSYNPGAPDSAGDRYQQQLNDLDIQASQEKLREQQSMFDLQQKSYQANMDFQAKQNDLALQGARQQLAVSGAQADLATAQLGQTTKEVQSGKIKGECGKDESSYYDRNTGQFLCKKSGHSGAETATNELGRVALNAGEDIASAYIRQYTAQISANRSSRNSSNGKTYNANSGIDRSTDYGTQHFNIPGNIF